MEQVAIYAVLYSCIIVFGIIPLIKKKEKKVLYVYAAVVIVTLLINVMCCLNTCFPSPARLIKDFITDILKMNNGLSR